MGAIDIGSAATNRASTSGSSITTIDKSNPANDTGTITSFECWFNTNGAGVKIGTFSGSGSSYDDRDYETIGSVTAGSKQTFSGLNCAVSSGDVIGIYFSSGAIDADSTGSGTIYTFGDVFGTGAQTYYAAGSTAISVYGAGSTPGWANISKVNGVASSSIAKVNGVAVASIAKVNGVAV